MTTSLESMAGAGRANGILRSHLAALGQNLAAGAHRLWDAYWDYQTKRATVLMPEALDDRTLKDIGISRREIRHTVLGGDTASERP